MQVGEKMEMVQPRAITADELKSLIYNAGATLVGFGDVSEGLAGELSHLPTAISIAVRHCPAEIIGGPRVVAYSHQLEAVDSKLEQIQKTTVSLLRSSGYKCLAIPPDSLRQDKRFVARLYPLFPHKTAATCSGLGWIGKSGLLVNQLYGPRMSWATVLTNAPLETSARPIYNGRCGDCMNCVKICPVGAVSNREWTRGLMHSSVDYDLCRQHLERNRQVFGKAVCGLCIIVCSRGRDID
ncbi:MAG: 4Fe-4S double cluster binding domain-containing protein [Desulfocucumaceae bacterium]